MCGIAGYIAPEVLKNEAMGASLVHRGPNAYSHFVDEYNGQQVYMCHTRLSIIDLSDRGVQPMRSTDGNIVLTFNGEVYNFLELKEKYLKGQPFTSTSDTEVVLKLYELRGIDFLNMLNGDFAITIYDKTRQKFFLIRDRLGVKPLYFYWKNEHLVFGSEIKALLASGIKPVLNEDAVQRYFVYKYSPEQETLFKDINRVHPGTYLEYDLDSRTLSEKTYWKLPDNTSQISYADAQEQLKHLMEDATKIRLIADVPIGSFLSGGLDSTIIASYLRDREDIVHFCASKNAEDLRKEGSTSDYHYARQLADTWGLNLKEIQIGSGELNHEQLDRVLHFGDDLIADGSQIPSYLITKEAAKEITVILSGMGADELFYGYAGHQLALLAQYFNKLPEGFRKPILRQFENLNTGSGRFKPYKRYLYKFGKNFKYKHLQYGVYSVVGDFENSMSIFRSQGADATSVLEKYFKPNSDPFRAQTQFEINNFLVKNLHYVDRMSMGNSVENRVPFLDHRLVEFAAGLPREYKLGGNLLTKKILKDTYGPQLPSYIIKRRKAGFGMPLRSIFSDTRKIDALLDEGFFQDFEGFSIEDIKRVKDEHLHGIGDNSSIIFALISFQSWYKKYIG